MPTAILIGESPVPVWGLTGRERLARQLRSLGNVRQAAEPPETGRVLLLRADYVFEQRALIALLGLDGLLTRAGVPVAGHIDARLARKGLDALEQGAAGDLPVFDAGELQTFEYNLRKSASPLVAPVTADNQAEIEDRLYGASYKGITDFVTKWWWPRPAKAGVRWCSRSHISPNMVTSTGFLLMLGTCWLFYNGQYAAGLALGWLMTYLDTVDGKLARVTSQSSPFGHALDHGMDIIHPPFWYWLWGLSLADFQPVLGVDRTDLYVAIFAAYAGGRVIEGVFKLLGETGIFSWRPFDAYFRLYTARRNPCLVLLTLSWAVASPDLGLWLVAGWTVLSSLVMLLRLAYGCWVRATEGRLTSWLAEPDAVRRYPRAYAEFSTTRQAYG